jgi:hypothetical protein
MTLYLNISLLSEPFASLEGVADTLHDKRACGRGLQIIIKNLLPHASMYSLLRSNSV